MTQDLAAATPILHLQDVRYHWPGRASFGLSVPNFVLKTGEKVLLLGKSGSGKSTLLSLICGTISAQSGMISVAGTDISGLSEGERDRFRADQIGLIFQQFNLLPYASVGDNILLPLRFAPERRLRVEAPYAEATQLCKQLELPKNVMSARAGTLSVGQQQRVAAARALIGSPPLIMADEPTSALDADTQASFVELLFELSRNAGSSILMVSHDARLANQFDRVVNLSEIAVTEAEAA